MIRRPPRSTRTDTLFPDPTLFRSALRDQHGQDYRWASVVPLRTRSGEAPQPKMATLRIDAGKTDKLRAGDILGALTGDAELSADAIDRKSTRLNSSH